MTLKIAKFLFYKNLFQKCFSNQKQKTSQIGAKMWDPCRMAVGCKILIIGNRGAGKTTLLRDLLHKRRGLFKDGEALIGGHTRDYEVPYLPAHRVHLVADGPHQFTAPSVWVGEEVGRQVLRSAEFEKVLAGTAEVFVTAQCVDCVPFDVRSKFDLVCPVNAWRVEAVHKSCSGQ